MRRNHEGTALTFGCPACIAAAEKARIDNAPMRRCRVYCTYNTCAGDEYDIEFTVTVRIPDGWKWWRVDTHYPDVIGEGFILALPWDVVPYDETQCALETMEVTKITIGDIVPDPTPVAFVQESLL